MNSTTVPYLVKPDRKTALFVGIFYAWYNGPSFPGRVHISCAGRITDHPPPSTVPQHGRELWTYHYHSMLTIHSNPDTARNIDCGLKFSFLQTRSKLATNSYVKIAACGHKLRAMRKSALQKVPCPWWLAPIFLNISLYWLENVPQHDFGISSSQ